MVIGAVVAIVIVGGILTLGAVLFLLNCAMDEWDRRQRVQYAQINSQMAALRSVLRVELAGRQALSQLSQLDQQVDRWSS
jgi:hypothetical protein